LTRTWSHDRAHAFFSRASWNPDLLGISLSHLIVRQLRPESAVLTAAVDDTLSKRRGKKVFGAAWQHDGAATGPRGVGRGTCFVVLGLVMAPTSAPSPRVKHHDSAPDGWLEPHRRQHGSSLVLLAWFRTGRSGNPAAAEDYR
jgi:hypothetical protein